MRKEKVESLLDLFGKALNPTMYGEFSSSKSHKKLKRID
jgi:hypothetical protein